MVIALFLERLYPELNIDFRAVRLILGLLKPPKQLQFLNPEMNLSLETIDQFLCYQFLTEYLKRWFIKDLLSLLINIIYYMHHNMDSAVGIVHSTQL